VVLCTAGICQVQLNGMLAAGRLSMTVQLAYTWLVTVVHPWYCGT
jgi:hypothetical protein